MLWLVPALPLLGSSILGLFGPAVGSRVSALIGAGSVGLAALIAAVLGVDWLGHPQAQTELLWTWIALPGFNVNLSLYLDPLSLLMMLVITIVGFFIHLFSTEYMQGEAGYSRYFAYLNLFVASMLLLVLADDLLVLFIGWEGVGVCSYLLVGFWFTEPENGLAARKSFVVTRIADIAMLVGLLILSLQLGTLSIQPMLAAAHAAWAPGSFWPELTAALLLIGGLGKSAQVPLQTWLPDAMAGPTPVSALIHAATMVTAGVYLVVRTHALFVLAPHVLDAIALGAAVTLLLAAFSGLVQTDIKRILAYSTMSQIGYMFLALGAGAWGAAMFHFLTHAVFKALLFLSAGAITMRLHHQQNIFAMGGLRERLPAAFWAFLAGAACLAALPIISAGFFSKELILSAVWTVPVLGPALWGAGILGAFLTATYIFRAVFVVFFGPEHTHVSSRYGARILLPLAVLGVAAVTIGWVETPVFLGGRTMFLAFLTPTTGAPPIIPERLAITLAGMAVPLAGTALAYGLYRKGFWSAQAARRPSALARLARSGFGFDVAYDALFVAPFMFSVRLLRRDPVDQLFIALEKLAISLHQRLRAVQTGQVRRYAGWLMAGSVATIALLVLG